MKQPELLKKTTPRMGAIEHIYNPSYVGSRDERIMVQVQYRQKV
jgi:hypothetical protein